VRILELSLKTMITEGGNIFKNVEGNSLTTRINRVDIIPTISWLERITQLPLLHNTLGSVGKKDTSGDLDIAVDQNAISKDDLIKRLAIWVKSQGNDPKDWIKKSGISVHFLTPINGNQQLGFVQSDLMFGDDIEHMKFGLHSAGDKSKFSGADRNLLMSSVAKSLPGDFKYSWQKGLINRTSSDLISKDPDSIAKVLLGKKYTRNDLDSVESIMSAVRHDPTRLRMLSDLAKNLLGTDGKKPSDVRVDSEEADRLHRIMSADQNPINETTRHNPGAINMVMQELGMAIPMVSQALHTIDRFELTIDNTPDLEELLNKYKNVIIKQLLAKVKDGIGYYGEMIFVNSLVRRLKATKINWPEIAVIEQSTKLEADRILNLSKS
jgi:hypothetical protein